MRELFHCPQCAAISWNTGTLQVLLVASLTYDDFKKYFDQLELIKSKIWRQIQIPRKNSCGLQSTRTSTRTLASKVQKRSEMCPNSSHVVLAPLELHVLSRKSCLEKTKRDWFSNDRSSLHVETMVHFYEMIHFDVGPYVSIFKTWEWSQMKAGKKSILLLCNSTTPNCMVPKYSTKTSGVRSFVQTVLVCF